jgi:hypothetical protein
MSELSESVKSAGSDEPRPDPFHRQIVGDHPSSVDKLGFDEYVDALARFVTDPGTRPPLTVSVEGVWGSGKTSFMRQLERKLDDDGYPVVWFNPWRHEKADEVWAAFMLAFLEEIRTALSGRRRLRGYLHLLRSRFDESQVKRGLVWKGLVAAVVLLVGVLAVGALGLLTRLTLGHL